MPGAILTFGPTHKKRKTVPRVTPVALAASYLTFQSWAFQKNAQGGHNHRMFNVLCGDNPPTIVDGYGIWTVINRPLRQGLTIPQGFNPAKLKIEIRFGIWDGQFNFSGWDTSQAAAKQVESNIDDLHWMAGGNSLGGPSPAVYIDSYRPDQGKTVRTDLMPPQYVGVPWVIDSGIEWGNSLRDKYGSRIYQEASFTVMGYNAPAGGASLPPEKTRLSGGFFKTTNTIKTARGIAASNSSESPVAGIESLARSICKSSRNNPCKGTRIKLERRSIDWVITPGTDVWVDSHFI